MLRLLLTVFIVLTTSVLSVVWLNNNSGEAVFVVLDQRIETTFTAFAMAGLALILALQVLGLAVYKVMMIPKNIKAYYQENKLKNQLNSLSEFVISVNNEDHEEALVWLKKLDVKLLGHQPTSVCGMMLDKISPDKSKYKSKLINLSRQKETSSAGLYELIRYSINNEEWSVVPKYVEELWKNVKSKGLARTYFKALVMAEDWDTLERHLDKSRLSLVLSREFTAYLNSDEQMSLLSLVRYKKAKKLIQEGKKQDGIKKLEEVISYYPGFISAVCYLVREYIDLKEYDKALKLLTKIWRMKPNYRLNPLVITVAHAISQGDFNKSHAIIAKVIGKQSKNYESYLLIAASALEADLFNLALDNIREALDNERNLRANLLMAEYCERSHGNKTEAIEWMRKAYLAAPDTTGAKYYFDFQTFSFAESKTSDCLKIEK